MPRAESARRPFRISNAWLNARANSDDHMDLAEIVRGNSPYLDWVVANEGANRDSIMLLAALDPTSIAAYDTSGGDNIYCRLAEENETQKRELVGKIVHPLAVKFVRARGTTARDIEILGNGLGNLASQY